MKAGDVGISGRVAWARSGKQGTHLRGSIGVTFIEIAEDLRKKLTAPAGGAPPTHPSGG